MLIVWTLYAATYVALLAGWSWALFQLRRFLSGVTAIGDEATLQSYKTLVRTQMYLALYGIACMVVGILLGVLLVRAYGGKGLAVVLLTNVVILLLGLYLKKVEEQARGLSVAPALADEYHRVSRSWLQKPLPDF